jgi:hypothetical protein
MKKEAVTSFGFRSALIFLSVSRVNDADNTDLCHESSDVNYPGLVISHDIMMIKKHFMRRSCPLRFSRCYQIQWCA